MSYHGSDLSKLRVLRAEFGSPLDFFRITDGSTG